MKGKELLKLCEIENETEIKLSTLQKHVREGKLKASKNGREYLVTRKSLNQYLGIENTDELLKKELEIAQLKQKIKSYEMQIKMINSFVNQMKIAVG